MLIMLYQRNRGRGCVVRHGHSSELRSHARFPFCAVPNRRRFKCVAYSLGCKRKERTNQQNDQLLKNDNRNETHLNVELETTLTE